MQEQMAWLATALEPYPWAYTAVMLAALLLLAWLANFVTKKVLVRGLRRLLGMLPGLRGDGDSPVVQIRAIPRLANVVPALVISAGSVLVPGLPEAVALVVRNLANVFIVFTVVLAISHVFDHINDVYE
ncbi:MAG: mechanosensitive ion channel family protein, partial [Gammaproteobacteria bacterium]|nr:mechanosensitive ion channel family protein [Gammaproteobacteria bacterium]